MKYRKKAVDLEAIQITEDGTIPPTRSLWIDDAIKNGTLYRYDDRWRIGYTDLEPGDWIIQQVGGKLTRMPNEIFIQNFEPVEDDNG